MHEALAHIPGFRVRVVSSNSTSVRTDSQTLRLGVDAPLEALSKPDILLIPGGQVASSAPLLQWLRTAHESAQRTAAVGSGALLLGQAGLLHGERVASSALHREALTAFGAEPSDQRWMQSGRLFTAQEGAACIDMALALLADLRGDNAAKLAQLALEYDPAPPFAPLEVSDRSEPPSPPKAASSQIAILLYDRMTALDAIGPYEVLSRLPGAQIRLVCRSLEPVRADSGLVLHPTHTLEEVPTPDVLVVGGATLGFVDPMFDPKVQSWLQNAHAQTRFTTSVCTGSLILASAGILEGHEATSHWSVVPWLSRFGARPKRARVIESGKLRIGGGVTAGLDFALSLAGQIQTPAIARSIQSTMNYDPTPRFDCGSPAKAGRMLTMLAYLGIVFSRTALVALRSVPKRRLFELAWRLLRGSRVSSPLARSATS